MNHDMAHCADYTKDCPQECFRGQLVRDLENMRYPWNVTWASLKGTDECKMSWQEGATDETE